jgi:hypothetical protein
MLINCFVKHIFQWIGGKKKGGNPVKGNPHLNSKTFLFFCEIRKLI